jgi:hypothetical protein
VAQGSQIIIGTNRHGDPYLRDDLAPATARANRNDSAAISAFHFVRQALMAYSDYL